MKTFYAFSLATAILLIFVLIAFCGCADFYQHVSEMDVSANGNYDQNTGQTTAVVGTKFYFREPKRVPNYSKDK